MMGVVTSFIKEFKVVVVGVGNLVVVGVGNLDLE